MLSQDLLSGAKVARLVWHSADFQGDELTGSAFPNADVRAEIDKRTNQRRYVSVDEYACIVKDSVDFVIDQQTKDGKGELHHREHARLALMQVGVVRSIEINEETPIFAVSRHPIKAGEPTPDRPANPAHCGIHNIVHEKTKGQGGRDYLDDLKNALLDAVEVILHYEDVFQEDADEEVASSVTLTGDD